MLRNVIIYCPQPLVRLNKLVARILVRLNKLVARITRRISVIVFRRLCSGPRSIAVLVQLGAEVIVRTSATILSASSGGDTLARTRRCGSISSNEAVWFTP